MSCLPSRAELELGAEGGRGKTIGFTVSLVGENGHPPEGAALFFKDLTQIEHKEEQERLKDRLAVLGQMAASLAHEIRNPLTSIEVTCSLLRRRLGEFPAELDLLDKITSEVRRLNGAITSSLEFVRPLPLNFQRHELLPLIEEAVTVAVGRGGRVETSWDEAVPPFLMDPARLRQVFENLILNAVEASGEQGTVRVHVVIDRVPDATSVPYHPEGARPSDPWHEAGRFVRVRVEDDGPGIPEADRDKIFYPFFTTKEKGSGVGLSTAKKIVNGHRGVIDVESAPSGGARFTVRLPMIDRLGAEPDSRRRTDSR
jgi:signal transduction histidine kinase